MGQVAAAWRAGRRLYLLAEQHSVAGTSAASADNFFLLFGFFICCSIVSFHCWGSPLPAGILPAGAKQG